jgi:hypothetical protein
MHDDVCPNSLLHLYKAVTIVVIIPDIICKNVLIQLTSPVLIQQTLYDTVVFKKNNPRSEQIADKKIDRGIISLCLLKTEELIQHRTLY